MFFLLRSLYGSKIFLLLIAAGQLVLTVQAFHLSTVPEKRGNIIHRAIAEAARVLRPGGKAYATVNSGEDLQAITDIILDVFGMEPMDFAASRVPLENLEALMADTFTDVTRRDMTDIYDCTDPEIVEAFILSMPPANQAHPEQRQRLKQRIAVAFEPDGILTARKHSGVVCGTMPN